MIRNYIFFLEKKKKKKEPLGAEQLHRAPPNYEGIHLGEGADKTHRTLEPTNFLSFFLSSFLLLPRALNTERDPRNIFKNIHGRKNPSTAEWRDSALEGIIIKKKEETWREFFGMYRPSNESKAVGTFQDLRREK